MPVTNLNFASIVTKNATYTANTYDNSTLVDATSASFTVNLMSAASMPGRTLTFKRIDTVSANTVTIDAFGAETINGSATFVLIGQDQELQIQSDGTNWIIVSPVKLNAAIYVSAPALFSTTSTSYVNVTGAQFATKTLSGGAQNPTTTNDLALKVAFLPKGTYLVMCYVPFANTTGGSSVNGRIFDGTNQIGQTGQGNATNAANSSFGGIITYSTDQSNITFTAQGKVAGAATFQTGTFNGASPSDVSLVVTRLN
jgi:hypothetical protein